MQANELVEDSDFKILIMKVDARINRDSEGANLNFRVTRQSKIKIVDELIKFIQKEEESVKKVDSFEAEDYF